MSWCVLCAHPIAAGRAHKYAEGEFCDDVAGCRRRALMRMRDMESTLVDMHGRLAAFEKFSEPEGEPDEPAHR